MTHPVAERPSSGSLRSLAQQPASAPRVLVIGSGIAGLTTALHAARLGHAVTLVTKDVLDHANTRYAQGGIAGVMFDDDRVDDHIRDTLAAGVGLGDPEAVRVLCAEGPARIRELIELGVLFDRAPDGDLAKGLEAAHSYPRVLHAGGDATGSEIEHTLVEHLRGSGIAVIEHAFLIDLVVSTGRVVGAELLVDRQDAASAARRTVPADAVVLATGGLGELFAYSTNPAVATGDGVAAALRAGAAVADLEFVQFHPTVLVHERPFLISEAVRGEGAVLRDATGRRFAFDAHPSGELAPRDVVARAIAATMSAQDGAPVSLDATALDRADGRPGFLGRRFPSISAALTERGLDWTRCVVPVAPAAHFAMGGVVTDLSGRTSVPGLYAVGEVARTGVHGANRLASNSLLEGAVFGARAAAAIGDDARSHGSAKQGWPSGPGVAPTSENHASVGVEGASGSDDGADLRPGAHAAAGIPFSRAALQRLMWDHVGLVRDRVGLEHAAAVIAAWRAQPRHPCSVPEFEDENLLLVAAATTAAALTRRDSVGAHYRADAPTPTPPRTPARVPAGAAA